MQKISLIAAVGKNRVIGNHGRLPWSLPADMKYFRDATRGHAVVMGRKTYESVGHPLPDRTNIVVTRQEGYSAPGCVVVASLDDAFAKAAEVAEIADGAKSTNDEIFVIGGGELYKESIARADKLYITQVAAAPEGDAYFPEIDPAVWRERQRTHGVIDEANRIPHDFVVFEKI